MGRKMSVSSAAMLAFLTMMIVSPVFASAQVVPYLDGFWQGPYIDTLLFKIYYGESDDFLLALLNNDIDVLSYVSVNDRNELEQTEYIETVGVLRNGFGHFTINCKKYPYNITAFRRAFAFALDKEYVSSVLFEGHSYPHDSPVPATNPFTVEGRLPYAYHAAQPEIGNQLLDDAGFHDVDADGIREAPDGSEFIVVLEASPSAIEFLQVAEDAFESIHVSAEVRPSLFYDFTGRVWHHGDYDICMYGTTFPGYNIDYLVEWYGSMFSDVDFANPSNFENSTFDSYIQTLMHSTEYDELYAAAIKMQEILVYECPSVPIYSNYEYAAYRSDRFEDFAFNTDGSINTIDSYRKVHLTVDQGGPWGGTFRVGSMRMRTFNTLWTSYADDWHVLRNMHVSLMDLGPDRNWIPFFAESYDIQTNAEDPNIPVGHTRIIFDMIQNATWSDGLPVTAEDVAFSLNYVRDGLDYGMPSGQFLQDLTVAYAASPYRVIAEFDSLSYWHLGNVGQQLIYPKHILEDHPLEDWYQYNPVKGDTPSVTAGPFVVNEHIPYEFTELTARRDWAYGIAPLSIQPTTTSTTSSPPPPSEPPNLVLVLVGGSIGAAIVILTGGSAALRKSPELLEA